MSGLPAEYGTGLGCFRGLVKQKYIGEIIPQPRARLLVGPWDRSRGSHRDGSSFCQFCDGGGQAVPDDELASGGVVFQRRPEHGGQVSDVDRCPMLAPGSEHDQVAIAVARRTQQDSRDASAAVAVCGARYDQDAAHPRLAQDALMAGVASLAVTLVASVSSRTRAVTSWPWETNSARMWDSDEPGRARECDLHVLPPVR